MRTDQTSIVWQCNVAAGLQITLSVRDSNGRIAFSAASTVRMSSLYPVRHEYMADEIENSSDQTCLPDYVAPDSYVPTSAAPYVRLMSDPRVSQAGQ